MGIVSFSPGEELVTQVFVFHSGRLVIADHRMGLGASLCSGGSFPSGRLLYAHVDPLT